ncbi:MAG: hypothetical protein COA78_12365 [Blastopirellula sp.]|nr:MAG: hypothetical protein COA78_12365 [Blastopirellula sp.]
MSIDLRWIASSSASCFHTAHLLATGSEIIDQQLSTELNQPVQALMSAIANLGLEPAQVWQHLIPLSAGIENNNELADVTLRKLIPISEITQSKQTQLSGCFQDLENAYRTRFPKLADELIQRIRPLREQWEARGPGLMDTVGRLTEPNLLVGSADVILVQPSSGGRGVAHLDYNSVRLEAMLYNVDRTLPEVVRLAWLISQLNLDLPVYSERIQRDRLRLIAGYAMLPACFQAAEEVELLSLNQASFAAALEAWRISPTDNDQLSSTLLDWWQTYQQTNSSWTVALHALDQMLADV